MSAPSAAPGPRSCDSVRLPLGFLHAQLSSRKPGEESGWTQAIAEQRDCLGVKHRIRGSWRLLGAGDDSRGDPSREGPGSPGKPPGQAPAGQAFALPGTSSGHSRRSGLLASGPFGLGLSFSSLRASSVNPDPIWEALRVQAPSLLEKVLRQGPGLTPGRDPAVTQPHAPHLSQNHKHVPLGTPPAKALARHGLDRQNPGPARAPWHCDHTGVGVHSLFAQPCRL